MIRSASVQCPFDSIRTYAHVRKTEWNRMDPSWVIRSSSVQHPCNVHSTSVQGPFNSRSISVSLKQSTVQRNGNGKFFWHLPFFWYVRMYSNIPCICIQLCLCACPAYVQYIYYTSRHRVWSSAMPVVVHVSSFLSPPLFLLPSIYPLPSSSLPLSPPLPGGEVCGGGGPVVGGGPSPLGPPGGPGPGHSSQSTQQPHSPLLPQHCE